MKTNTYEIALNSQVEVKVIPVHRMDNVRFNYLTSEGWELIEITDDGYGEGSFVFNRKKNDL